MASTKPPMLLIAGGIILALGLLLSAVVVPVYTTDTSPAPDFNGDGTSDGTYSVTINFVDVYGNYLQVMPFELTANGGGEPIDHIVVTAGWVVSGEYVDWDTLSVSVSLELREYGVSYDYELIHADTKVGSGANSQVYFYIYEADFSLIDDGFEHILNAVCDFTATADDTSGNPIDPATDTMGSAGFGVTIGDAPGEMVITGTVSVDSVTGNIIAFSAVDVGNSPLDNPATAVMAVGVVLIIAWVFMGGKR